MIAFSADQKLVRESLAGDREAYGHLVRLYENRLYPTLLRLLGSPDDARDLLQDAFIRAFEKLDQFQGDSSFFTWLYRIAINLALSKRRRHGPSCVPFPSAKYQEFAGDATRDDPTLPLQRAELECLVQQALNELHEDQRAVVVLKDLEGMRYEEISDLLEIPIGTVRSRLHRARSELRERLRDAIEPTRETVRARGVPSVG
jgi:RNA polymerase sigma-70 factor (ECF subfamily)